MATSTRCSSAFSLWRTAGVLAAGAGLLLAGLQPAHAAETTPDGGYAELPPAEQSQELKDAGLSPEDLQREEALERLSRTTNPDFYTTPAQLPAANGSVLRHEASVFYVDPINLIKPNAESTRILYKTTNARNEAVAASGTVLKSKAAWKKSTPRPLVVMSPGTQGVDDSCAPSRQLALGTNYEGINLTGLVNAGYNVVVPDYIGLGTEGIHTYMNRTDQAHAVLDAVRAAQGMGIDGISAKTPVGAVGYSQGGGATAAAAEAAGSYAPEIDLKGAWAGAPPADLAMTGKNLDSAFFAALPFYVVAGAEEYGVPFRESLNEKGQVRYDNIRRSCTIKAVVSNALVQSRTLTKDGRSISQMIGDPQMSEYLQEQKIGTAGRHPSVPVRIAHSVADDVVPYQSGRQLAQRWCASGSNVSFQPLVTPTHLGGYVEGLPSALEFLNARFSGQKQLSSCWRL
ncbi:lipase family protein [Kocuria marina]|uniref:lipase family protein n=1 Tax=Kocuria marina TaxID=223184 RepID=UPI0021A57419|nr:lipase family protein [Kocuria marina]MCT1617460.1 lipase family protein [Kocuria marina]